MVSRIKGSLVWRLTWRVFKELGDDQATHAAAGVAYFAIFSIFPLILGLLAVSGIFLGNSPELQGQFLSFLTGQLPGSERFLEDTVQDLVRFRGVMGLGAILGLFWGASAVFGAITLAVNRAWDVEETRPFLVAKGRQFVMALGVGILFLFSLATTSLVLWLGSWPVVTLLSYLFTFGMFALMYKYLPNTQTYWRYVWVGALVAAILFEVAKGTFMWYLANVANFAAYGSLASVLVFLVWAYFSALILIIGAEVATEYERMQKGPE